jgi:radical SAM protein (TIGR01212 family)
MRREPDRTAGESSREDPGYRRFSVWLRERYGRGIRKVALDAGFGCPHRVGLDRGGCLFCDASGGGNGAALRGIPIRDQLRSAADHLLRRPGKNAEDPPGVILYLQSYSGTNAPPERLAETLEGALDDARACGLDPVSLALGARPDQIGEEHLNVLERWIPELDVWIELGIQTTDPAGLRWLRRGHGPEALRDAAERIRGRGSFLLCGHLICGIPGEAPDQLARSAGELASLGFDAVKFHPLHVLEGTPLADLLRRGQFVPVLLDAYVETVVEALLRLPPTVVVQRLTADAMPPRLLAPSWVARKGQVIRAIEDHLVRGNLRQGDRSGAPSD